jgi:DNA primase
LPLLKPGQSLRFALLPAGEDPDTLIIAQGAGAMRAVLDAALPLAEMVWRAGVQGRTFDTPERRAGLRQEVRERLSKIADRPVQEAYRVEFDRRLDALFGQGKFGQGKFAQGKSGQTGPARARIGEKMGEKRRFGPPPALGGEAARQAGPDNLRLQGEVILATLINHPMLVASRLEALAHLNLPAGQLDKLRQAIIDHAAHHPDLDPEGLKDHLISQGFAAFLPEILRRAGLNRFTLPSASVETAGEGLDHVLGLLRERAMQQEADAAARQFGEALTDETQSRFERARDLALEGESRRRDIDGPEQGG